MHNKKLHKMYENSSSNIIRIIKSNRLRWAEHVASVEEKRNAYRV